MMVSQNHFASHPMFPIPVKMKWLIKKHGMFVDFSCAWGLSSKYLVLAWSLFVLIKNFTFHFYSKKLFTKNRYYCFSFTQNQLNERNADFATVSKEEALGSPFHSLIFMKIYILMDCWWVFKKVPTLRITST